ncbi:LPXTG cell wall anchor domain-containing protein [Streptomyces sp. CGMCC 4.7035]|nr:LPXTG cell wall anchor domain-containing protein [Streptomyces sp. CGMCC 4.7035]WNB97281.1 LPXTG cell wall anchor domain-containing protein [Streptomyces sp. CGMCC 4.7035]
MKLRRVLAASAATAALAPLALLSAPTAFAEDPSSSPSSSVSATETAATQSPTSPAPETGITTTPAGTESTTPSSSASAPLAPVAKPSKSATTSATPSGSAEPTDEPSGDCTDQDSDYKSKLDAKLTGLPGKIAVGSGWHPFTLKVTNPTKSTLKDVIFYAGVGPADEDAENPFKPSQVQLQAKVDGAWVDVEDEGYSFGYLELSDIDAGRTVDYQLRLNVKADAPIGAGLTVGGGVYFDEEENCVGAGQAGYIVEIVKSGTDTGGTRPQEGGKVPLPTTKPNSANTQLVTGSLASTGSSSALPTIALVGGVAVIVGGGAVFAVRRRKTGGQAA